MVIMSEVEKIRSNLGIPKTIIAKKCNVSVNTYDNWLKNPDMIRAVSAKSLADALNVTDVETLVAIFFAPNVQKNVNT